MRVTNDGTLLPALSIQTEMSGRLSKVEAMHGPCTAILHDDYPTPHDPAFHGNNAKLVCGFSNNEKAGLSFWAWRRPICLSDSGKCSVLEWVGTCHHLTSVMTSTKIVSIWTAHDVRRAASEHFRSTL